MLESNQNTASPCVYPSVVLVVLVVVVVEYCGSIQRGIVCRRVDAIGGRNVALQCCIVDK